MIQKMAVMPSCKLIGRFDADESLYGWMFLILLVTNAKY